MENTAVKREIQILKVRKVLEIIGGFLPNIEDFLLTYKGNIVTIQIDRSQTRFFIMLDTKTNTIKYNNLLETMFTVNWQEIKKSINYHLTELDQEQVKRFIWIGFDKPCNYKKKYWNTANKLMNKLITKNLVRSFDYGRGKGKFTSDLDINEVITKANELNIKLF